MDERPDVALLARTGRPAIPMPARRWRTRVLLPAAIAAAVIALLVYSAWETIVPATAVRAVPVVVKALAGEAPGSVTVQAPGWIEPDPHPYFVPALTSGVVAELSVLEGDRVEAGQVVARLIDDDAKLSRERAAAVVEEHRGAVRVAEAELEAARQSMATLVDRKEAVDRGRAQVAAIDAEHKRLDAEIHAAEATASATRDEYDRKAPLAESRAVSRGEVERLRLRLAADQAALAAKRAAVPVLQARREAAAAALAAATRNAELLIGERLALQSAEAKLAAARAAERRAVAELGEAELRLARMEVRATVSGVVLRRLVSPGSWLLATSREDSVHVVHLYDPQKLQVRVDVPLADAAQVGVGQAAEIVADALPERVLKGVVTRLVHYADVAKRTVEVKVRIADPDPVLKPEMLARVRFRARPDPAGQQDPEGPVRQRVFAPLRAVQTAAGGSRVLVVEELRDGRGRVAVREVVVGERKIDDHVEISSGLRPGDRVIVDAPAGLAAGARVVLSGGDR